MPELTFWTDLFPVAPVLYHLLNQGLQAASEAKNAMSWIFLPAPPYKALVMIYFFPLTFFGFVLGPLIRQYLPNSGSVVLLRKHINLPCTIIIIFLQWHAIQLHRAIMGHRAKASEWGSSISGWLAIILYHFVLVITCVIETLISFEN